MTHFFLFLLVFLFSCSKRESSKKCQVTIAMPCDPSSLDPGKGNGPYSSLVLFSLYEGLTRFAKDKPYELALAKSVSVSKDKTQYTFHLKKTFWSNGKPLTAHDFYDSWARILNPDFPAPNAHLFYSILNAKKVKTNALPKSALGIKVLDDYTLQVTLKRPTHYFLKLTAFCCFSPQYQNKKNTSDNCLVSNGPFTLDSYIIKNNLILKKNPHYHDHSNVQIDSIKLSIINDENTALNMFNKGTIDILGAGLTEFTHESKKSLKKKGLLKSHQVASTSFYTFNIQKPPFNNKNLRKAFLLATNKKIITDHIVEKQGSVANNITPITLLDCDNKHHNLFNPKLAKQHLKKALQELGVSKKQLSTICLHYCNQNIEKKKALLLQQQWKEILELDVTLEECEFKVLMTQLYKKNYTIALGSLVTQFDDPIEVLDRFKHQNNQKNFPGFEDPNYKKILKQSQYLLDDERQIALKRAQEILMDEVVLVPLYHFDFLYIKQPRIDNFFISKIGSIHLNSITLNQETTQTNNNS